MPTLMTGPSPGTSRQWRPGPTLKQEQRQAPDADPARGSRQAADQGPAALLMLRVVYACAQAGPPKWGPSLPPSGRQNNRQREQAKGLQPSTMPGKTAADR